MISSQEPEVVKVGSRQICVASFELEEAKHLMECCLRGTDYQRLGASQVFAANVKVKPDFCKYKLMDFFSDQDEQVRKEAAGCFRHLIEEDLDEFADLIEAFIESPAFDLDSHDLIWAMKKATGKLPEIIYKVCKRFVDSTNISAECNSRLEIDVS